MIIRLLTQTLDATVVAHGVVARHDNLLLR